MAKLTPWSWWVGMEGCDTFDIDECSTREDAIRSGCRWVRPGDRFDIIEARMWERSTEPENPDHVPFAQTRNRETITVGPQDPANGR